MHHHLHFNFLAILVCTLIQWFLGALWYSPVLFAKPWIAMAAVPAEKRKKSMIAGMIVSFVGSLVASFVLAHFVLWAGRTAFLGGAFIGLLAWLGFICAPLAASYIYESRPCKLFAINTGYWLVALIISGGVLAVWR